MERKSGINLANDHPYPHRKAEVVQGILDGMSNQEIGQHLGIKEGTVKKHVHGDRITPSIFSRTKDAFGIRPNNRASLVRILLEKGLAVFPFIRTEDTPIYKIGKGSKYVKGKSI